MFNGPLAHFTPKELREMLGGNLSGDDEEGRVVIIPLLEWLFLYVSVFSILLGVGIFLMIYGLKDMSSDLGASVSPLGLMVFGIGLVGFWFSLSRFFAARYLMNNSVPRIEVIRMYNSVCPFTGDARVEVASRDFSSTTYGKEGTDSWLPPAAESEPKPQMETII